MPSGFKITACRTGKHMRVHIIGDFDPGAAVDLLAFLRYNCRDRESVVINTSRLRSIHPFGQYVFEINSSLLCGKRIRLVFCGQYADKIAPGWSTRILDGQGPAARVSQRMLRTLRNMQLL